MGKVPVHTTDAETKATPELDQFAESSPRRR